MTFEGASLKRMTSRPRKGSEPPKSPHFFKVILSSDALPGEKLEIPKRFLQRHSSDLPSLVFLKVPSSLAVWPVELDWSDGMAWLGQGWQKFRDYYSIGFGQFLVFRYEPSSVFHVIIFSTNASEIKYPTDPMIVAKSEPECEFPLLKKEETDKISAEISEDCRPSPKTRKKSKSALASASQKVKSGTGSEDVDHSYEHQFPGYISVSSSVHSLSEFYHLILDFKMKYFSFYKLCTGMIRKSTSRASPSMPAARRRNVPCPAALEMARNFKSKHPVFKLVVYPSYFKKHNANVSTKFMRTYIKRSVQVVTLKYKKDSWLVKLIKCPDGRGKFYEGWFAFARATYLCEGDVCVFELTKHTRPVLEVSIFRSSGYT